MPLRNVKICIRIGEAYSSLFFQLILIYFFSIDLNTNKIENTLSYYLQCILHKMLALMIEKLAGFEPLQRKILLYCFETPTSTAIKPVITVFEERRKSEKDQNNATLWRYYNENFNAVLRECREDIRNLVAYVELKFAKEMQLNNAKLLKFEELQKIALSNKYYLLSAPESVHGTPSCICIRNYMISLFMRGIQFRDHETLWGKFSYGEIRNRHRNNMSHLLCPTVKNDLTNAMKESKQYSSHISFW